MLDEGNESNEIIKFRDYLNAVFDKSIRELNLSLSEDKRDEVELITDGSLSEDEKDKAEPIIDGSISEDERDETDPFIEKLYSEIVKTCNEGKNIPDTIERILSENEKSSQDVFEWLLSHQNKPENICIRALFHYYKIGGQSDKDVYELFLKAENENIIAKYFVGKCLEEGRNVKKSKTKAINYYEKAEAGNCAAAGYAIGLHYFKQHKYSKAFTCLKKSAEGNNMMALNLLGLCYQKSFGTGIKYVEAFKCFLKAAEMGLPESQYRLGKCYEMSEGTKGDLEQALHWYQMAMDNEYQCYNDFQRVKIAKNQEL
ncbi:10249_t:CDS:1, partial [Cetraspora pellucida]